ncbi:MAG: THUMP domain-containing protein [Candidatus Kariarchaeaceae archaeon]
MGSINTIKSSYYIKLNGRFPEVAFIEAKSIIEIFDPKAEIELKNKVIMLVKVHEKEKKNFIKFYLRRTGLSIRVIEKLGESPSFQTVDEYRKIFDEITLPPWEEIKARSFRVTAVYSFEVKNKVPTNKIEGAIGAYIKKRWEKAEVNLTAPEVEFIIEICFGKVYLGINYLVIISKEEERRAYDRAIFRPGTMRTAFAKVIVNLSGARKGEMLIDPFCGVGGIIIEAEKLGIHSLGIEIDRLIARGAAKNVQESGSGFTEIIKGTALNLPIRTKENYVIATDPPYDRAVIPVGEKGRTTSKRLFEQFLEEVQTWEIRPKRIGVAVPKEFDLPLLAEKYDYKLVMSSYQQVHGSLTRHFGVMKL